MNKKLRELREFPHHSASALSTFMGCQLQYRFRYIDQIPSASKSSALILGSAIHQVLENYWSALRDDGEILSCEDLQELFELRLKWQCDNAGEISYKDGEDYKSLLALGKGLVKCYSENIPDEDGKVLYVEEPFSIDLPGVDLAIIGSVDLVIGTEDSIIIIDHKTAGKGLSSSDIDLLEQLTIYQIVAKQMGWAEDKEILLRLDTMIKNKTPRFESYWTSRNDLDEQRLIRKFQTFSQSIKDGHYIPNDGNWRCGGCSYRNKCKEWGCEKAA